MSTSISMQVEWQGASGTWYWQRRIPPWTCPQCMGRALSIHGSEPCFWCDGVGVVHWAYDQANYGVLVLLGSGEPLRRQPPDASLEVAASLYYWHARRTTLHPDPMVDDPAYETFFGHWCARETRHGCPAYTGERGSWRSLNELLSFDYASRLSPFMGDPYTFREEVGVPWFAFLKACRLIDKDPTRVRLVYGFGN